MPTVSVIVPIYNVEQYLHRCIDSILAQTLTDYELILVDDGSPDRCGEICDEYAKKDNRIHVIHKENGGLSDARNKGIDWAFANSDSQWITFIDSDDWIHPKYLEYLYRGVKETGCPISVCSFEETTGSAITVDESSFEIETVDSETFFCENNVNAVIACAKMYKKDFFKEIRYPFGKLHEDEFITYKLLFQCETLAWINAPLYAYFKNESGITKSEWNPKRLDAVEALIESLIYLKKRKLIKAYVFRLKHTANCIYYNYNNIKKVEGGEDLEKYIPLLRKYMKKVFFLSFKYNIFPIRKYTSYYDIAFPFIMKIFWYIYKSKKTLY